MQFLLNALSTYKTHCRSIFLGILHYTMYILLSNLVKLFSFKNDTGSQLHERYLPFLHIH